MGDKKTKLSLLDKRDEEQSDGGSWNIQKSDSSGINASSSKLRVGVENKKAAAKTVPFACKGDEKNECFSGGG